MSLATEKPAFPLLSHAWAPPAPKDAVAEVNRYPSWEEYLAICNHLNGVWGWTPLWAIWQLVLWAIAAWLCYDGWQTPGGLLLSPALLIVVQTIWEHRWPPYWAYYDNWATNAEAGLAGTRILVAASGIWGATPDIVQHTRWSFFTGYRMREGCLYLLCADEVWMYYCASMFDSDQAWSRVQHLVRSALRDGDAPREDAQPPAAEEALALPPCDWSLPVAWVQAGDERVAAVKRCVLLNLPPLQREDADEACQLHFACAGRSRVGWAIAFAVLYAVVAWQQWSLVFACSSLGMAAWAFWFWQHFKPFHYSALERPGSPYHVRYQYGFCEEGICQHGADLHALVGWNSFAGCMVSHTHLVLMFPDRSWVFPRALAQDANDAQTMVHLAVDSTAVWSREA